ncbi:MAG: hypothetical protein J5846_00475 [Desulfovibrio sp.]|nr:hypothetical protein [Desulfovibrio sp.]
MRSSFLARPWTIVLLLFLAWLVLPSLVLAKDPVQDSAKERQELWSGSIYTSKFRCGFCFSPTGKARGVLLLRTLYGQVDVYHLYGSISQGHVDVRHSSGHHVVGDIQGDTVTGSITLGSGRTISFKGKRQTGQSLAPDDCAPPAF